LAVLLDTSVLYALIDRDEQLHDVCSGQITREEEAVIIPAPVMTEITYLVNRRLGAAMEVNYLRELLASDWAIEPMNRSDLARTLELLEMYASANLGFVDAATVAIAERLDVRRIYTLDPRDLALVRPAHTPAFELLP
jgi:predicted nucleic acid-binding protein